MLVRRSWAHKTGQIALAQWEPGAKSISFMGVDKRGIYQLYLFDIYSGKVIALTHWRHENVANMIRKGDAIFNDSFLPVSSSPTYPVHVVTQVDLQKVIDGKEMQRVTFVSYRGGAPRKLNTRIVKPPVQIPRRAHALRGLSVTLYQGANEPPVMMASDGRHTLPLVGPDPALHDVLYNRWEPFQWHDSSGETMTGGLLLPHGSRKGPLPLVIQAYEYEPKMFLPDGQDASTTYAAQSLAARGMAVLTIDIPCGGGPVGAKECATPQEGLEFADWVDSAVKALATYDLIDPSRVGLVGFSRAGFDISYVVTHPGAYPPAVALTDDSFTGTYASMLLNASVAGPSDDLGSLYGGTFWQNETGWLQLERTFNVDKVQTPLLISAHNQSGVLLSMDLIGAFGLNHRPIEFLEYPSNQHEITVPRQIVANLEMTTDWMAYWLKGEIPPNRVMAMRWAQMRNQQQAVLDGLKAAGKSVAPLPRLVPAPAWAIAAHSSIHL